MRDGVVHHRRADHRAGEDGDRVHVMVTLHVHDRGRRRTVVVMHDDRARRGVVDVMHDAMLVFVVAIAVAIAVAITVAMTVAPVMAAVGKRRGGQRKGCEEDGDFLEHVRPFGVDDVLHFTRLPARSEPIKCNICNIV